jgi:hypothetical protein
MSLAASAGASGASEADSERGRRLATRSLLMLPMLLLTAAVGAFVGFWLLSRHDLEGSEPMSAQGGYGWMVWAVTTAIFLAPAAVGLVLGLRARRHGAGLRGTLGVALNGLILLGIPTLELVNMLGE